MPKIVYVLTNPAMPDLVKIGFTSRSEVSGRIAQLSRQTGVPLPFRCHFAGEVSHHAANVEKLVHKTFAKSQVTSGKEFFSIEPDEAVAALELANARDVTPQFQQRANPQEKRAIKTVERTRRGKTILEDLGIRPGAKLTFAKDHRITCTVAPDNKVRFEGRILSLSAAALKVLRKLGYKAHDVAGTKYWMLDGKTVGQIRREKESRKGSR